VSPNKAMTTAADRLLTVAAPNSVARFVAGHEAPNRRRGNELHIVSRRDEITTSVPPTDNPTRGSSPQTSHWP
jgi:hypothetical protein